MLTSYLESLQRNNGYSKSFWTDQYWELPVFTLCSHIVEASVLKWDLKREREGFIEYVCFTFGWNLNHE